MLGLGETAGVDVLGPLPEGSGAACSGAADLRWDARLFFASSELFRQNLHRGDREVADVGSAEPITSVDVTATDMLAELETKLRQSGVELALEMKDPVKDKLRRFELLDHSSM